MSEEESRSSGLPFADADTCAHVMQLERALLDPAARRDRAQVEALLAEDFQEFGASGRVWSRQAILDLLADEIYSPPEAEEMRCTPIAAGVILVTYRAVRNDTTGGTRTVTLRSSLWNLESGGWRLRFHQGTRVP